ncbi:MAG: hypothetical protein MUE96_10105 [Bacteroidia bacterium]|jgi:hypothetical protein|nr:hypothetical protein [Bacteroidia bacterium]
MVNDIYSIIDLYDELIFIEEPTQKGVKETENNGKINFEGLNKKQVVFVFEHAHSEETKTLIDNLIANAMKYAQDDIAQIFTHNQQSVTLEKIGQQFTGCLCVIWGQVDAAKSMSLYGVTSLHGCQWMKVHPASHYVLNPTDKHALWNNLKPFLRIL